MPTIRIDDDVFNGLKALAEPFVDTPNSVIRKLLEASGALTRLANGAAATPTETVGKSTSVPAPQSLSGLLTPQTVYESFLLHVLATEFKGRGHKRVVTERVIEAMKAQGHIGPADLERVSTRKSKHGGNEGGEHDRLGAQCAKGARTHQPQLPERHLGAHRKRHGTRQARQRTAKAIAGQERQSTVG
jgi:hypothetical protein